MEKTGTEPYIVFEVAGTTYGVPSRFVQQLEMMENITPVPNTSPYVEGVMFARGQVVPVISLRKRFGLEKREYDVSTRIIVVRYQERIAGMIVDSAREYLNLPAETIQPAPEFLSSGQNGLFLEGIAKTGKRIILIFNIAQILKLEENRLLTN